MLHFTKNTTANIIVTLTEMQSATVGVYGFKFTHRLTKEVVSFTLPTTADISSYKNRYNKFIIEVNDYFGGATPGQYSYEITSDTLTACQNVQFFERLEVGVMQLIEGKSEAFTQFNSTNTFISI